MTGSVAASQAGNAAVMLMLLEDEQAAGILSQLSPDELQVLGEKMCSLGDIQPDAINTAIAGFVERTSNLGFATHDRVGQVEALMTRAVGDLKAKHVMRNIAPDRQRPSPLELARWLAPQTLLPLIEGEHPQTIALLLLQLDPDTAAQVLHALPKKDQPEIVHRIATVGPVHPDSIALLEEMLTRRIDESRASTPLAFGGPRNAADIMNGTDKTTQKWVMPQISKRNKPLAKAIENEMFKFEHLYELDQQAMGALLREVESETLIDALKGIAENERDVFLSAMSSRAADGVRDEIAARGRLKLEEVLAAQQRIVAVARSLAADGTIVFGAGDDEYV
ncbi:MAG: flagellar motor switch protein FliG [Novosphingobium sp.]